MSRTRSGRLDTAAHRTYRPRRVRATTPPDALAERFAAIARELQAASNPLETRESVTRAAVLPGSPGCAHAATSLIQ